MADLNIFLNGRSESMNQIVKQGYTLKLVLSTPDSGQVLNIDLVLTDPAGNVEEVPVSVLTQAQIESLLLPSGGGYGTTKAAAVEAITATIVGEFDTAFNTIEAAALAATGAVELAAVTAILAAGQTTLDTLLAGKVTALDAVLP